MGDDMDTEAEDTQDPTSNAAPDLIDLQNPVLSLARPSCDITSPAPAEEFILLDDSEDQSYIQCSQVSTKRICVLPPRNRMIMSPVMEASIVLPTALRSPYVPHEELPPIYSFIYSRDPPTDAATYPTKATLPSTETSPRVHMIEPVDAKGSQLADTDHTPSLRSVYEAASVQPLSCCHAIQTRRRTRAATQGNAPDTVTSTSGPVHGTNIFTEKFVMILEPFQLIFRTDEITGMTVLAILNSNNEYLDENEGVAQPIMNAGGVEVVAECQSHQ